MALRNRGNSLEIRSRERAWKSCTARASAARSSCIGGDVVEKGGHCDGGSFASGYEHGEEVADDSLGSEMRFSGGIDDLR